MSSPHPVKVTGKRANDQKGSYALLTFTPSDENYKPTMVELDDQELNELMEVAGGLLGVSGLESKLPVAERQALGDAFKHLR